MCEKTWKAYMTSKSYPVTINGKKEDFITLDEKWLRVVESEFKNNQYNLDSLDLGDAKVIFDVGANIGFFSIFMAKAFPSARIYAFEPVPENFAQLCWNLGKAGVENVVPLNFGIGDVDGVKVIQSIHHWNQGGSTMNNFKEQWPFDTFNVQSRTLATALRYLRLPSNQTIDFLKVDCEGCEHLAFDPADPTVQQLIKRTRYMAGEAHQLEGENKRAFDFAVTYAEKVIEINPEINVYFQKGFLKQKKWQVGGESKLPESFFEHKWINRTNLGDFSIHKVAVAPANL